MAKKEKPETDHDEPSVTVFDEDITPKRQKQRDAGSTYWGVVFVFIGMMLLLNTLGVVPWVVWDVLRMFWPVLVIFIGLHIMIGNGIISALFLFTAAVIVFGTLFLYGLETQNIPIPSFVPEFFRDMVSALKGLRI